MTEHEPGDAAGEGAARVAFDDLASLNLDAYDGLSLEGIGEVLAELAGRASTAQLEAILDGPGSVGRTDDEDKPILVDRYVAWRLDTVRRLRNLQRTLVIEGLD